MYKGIYHIVLFCEKIEETKEWYERIGFTYLRGYDQMYWFQIGDIEIMLHPTKQSSGKNSPELHIKVDNVDEVFAQLKEKGFKPFDHQQPGVELTGPVQQPWGVKEFQVQDPEGHRWTFGQVINSSS